MAKITARGATEVAAVIAITPTAPDTRLRFVLRSDGKILRRFLGDLSTGYSVRATLRPGVPVTRETLERYVRACGYAQYPDRAAR